MAKYYVFNKVTAGITPRELQDWLNEKRERYGLILVTVTNDLFIFRDQTFDESK